VAGARHFDDITAWGPYQGGAGLWGATGWTVPGDGHYIADADKYWGWILQKARDQYGDPGVRFNTNDTYQPRYLVFGDGTRVPADRTLVYHDTASRKNWIQNDDGTVIPADSDFKPIAAPFIPAGYRHTPDGKYAPVDAHGSQISPAVGSPPTERSWHADRNGVLTPINARGDYYEIDPATGLHRYFDRNGHPISSGQYSAAAPTDTPGGAPPGAAAPPTDEQQSGRTADAVKKLQDELKKRYSDINDAEGKLVESLLTARATTADGQRQLNDIQKKIVEAVNNPDLAVDTPAGEAAFLKFLRGQVAAIGAVVASGTLTADDQAKTIAALTRLYALQAADEPPTSAQPQPTDPGEPPIPAAATPGTESDPGATDPVPADPQVPMLDPTPADPGLGGAPIGSDPLSSLAPLLPAAMGGFPAPSQAGSPADSLAGLAGPLAGLSSQLGGLRDEPAKHDIAVGDTKTDDGGEPDGNNKKGADSPPAPAQAAPAGQQPQPAASGPPGQDTPSVAPAPVAAQPSTAVELPDGSTVTARTPAVAAAVKSCLAGTPVDVAYRQAGIELPPPGTPVTNPVDPSALTAGAIGMFKDHYVVALSAAKALQDGQVVSLSSAAYGPDFLGWMDPSTGLAPVAQPATQPPQTPPVAVPLPVGAG
jgi:Domain of unknown function (DUF4226)